MRSRNWRFIAHACATIALRFVAANETLDTSVLSQLQHDRKCIGLYTNADLLPSLIKFGTNLPPGFLIIYDGIPAEGLLGQLRSMADLQILSIEQLWDKGQGNLKVNLEEWSPQEYDVACIAYTRGTTGPPKGVVLTHANLIASGKLLF